MIYLSFVCCCSCCQSNLKVNKNPTTCLYSHTSIYSKYMILLKGFPVHISLRITPSVTHQFRFKTRNNVSKFMHSNCIMLSYYSSPKHKESVS